MKKEYFGIEAESPEQALCKAVNSNLFKAFNLLVESGADVNGPQQLPGRPLDIATYLGHKRMVKLLIDLGAKLEFTNRNDLTPLLVACSSGGKRGSEIAMMLIEAGANINYVRESDDMTALKFACGGYGHCNPEIIKSLLEKGVEVDGPAGTKQTALMLSARKNDIEAIKILIAYGADIKRKCGLKWANGAAAEELASMEGRRKAALFLKGVREAHNTNKG